MMTYTPKEYFYSLFSNQNLHDQETEKVKLVTTNSLKRDFSIA